MHGTNQEIKECIDLRACAYMNWHKKFRKITFDSVCIPLPEEIIKYLLDEIIILPKECYKDDDNEDDTFAGTDTPEVDDEDDDKVLVRIFTKKISTQFKCWKFVRLSSNPNFPSSVNL